MHLRSDYINPAALSILFWFQYVMLTTVDNLRPPLFPPRRPACALPANKHRTHSRAVKTKLPWQFSNRRHNTRVVNHIVRQLPMPHNRLIDIIRISTSNARIE